MHKPGHGPGAAPRIIALSNGDTLNEGRYRIDRELNRGGTAVVYAAEDQLTRRHVALKVMNGPDQVPIKVVRREITFSSSMQHDNIVRLLDVFAEKQQMVIVWELIRGPDLLDLLNENGGTMPEPMAAFYFVQLLEAVTFMHAQGFCHRDIKPENCMVQRSNQQLKLIDFGLSKHLNSAYTLGVGTPDYMCPEMLPRATSLPGQRASRVLSSPAPAPSYDARAVDAWAMGVLMFLLTTGKYPFEDPRFPNNLAHTIGNVLAGRVRPFPNTMSSPCGMLISGLLRIDPRSRTTLEDLKANPWLKEQALQYACAVGCPHLVDFSRYAELPTPPTLYHAHSMPSTQGLQGRGPGQGEGQRGVGQGQQGQGQRQDQGHLARDGQQGRQGLEQESPQSGYSSNSMGNGSVVGNPGLNSSTNGMAAPAAAADCGSLGPSNGCNTSNGHNNGSCNNSNGHNSNSCNGCLAPAAEPGTGGSAAMAGGVELGAGAGAGAGAGMGAGARAGAGAGAGARAGAGAGAGMGAGAGAGAGTGARPAGPGAGGAVWGSPIGSAAVSQPLALRGPGGSGATDAVGGGGSGVGGGVGGGGGMSGGGAGNAGASVALHRRRTKSGLPTPTTAPRGSVPALGPSTLQRCFSYLKRKLGS